MATDLNVNDHHQAQVYNFIRFARYQRGQRMRAVDFCFEELKSTRLDESTYTIDEVTDMLDGLLTVVRGEVENELVNTVHTNVLLMRQMFIQSEKWHLKLSADISELENREILEKIAEFEEQQFAGTKRDTDLQSMLKHVKLGPMNETGGTTLLHMKIEELQQENDKLQDNFATLSAASASSKQLLDSYKSSSGSGQAKGMGANSAEMNAKMAALQKELESGKKSSGNTSAALEGDITSTKHELLRVRDMLEMAEKELEKKVSNTTPFKNLKQMMLKKNETLKELRKRLAKYESLDDE